MLRNSSKTYRKKTKDKKYDPMALKNRIQFLENDLLQIQNSEQDYKKLVGFN